MPKKKTPPPKRKKKKDEGLLQKVDPSKVKCPYDTSEWFKGRGAKKEK